MCSKRSLQRKAVGGGGMKKLTDMQEIIISFIREHPDCQIVDIAVGLNVPWREVMNHIDYIEGSGVLIAENEGKFSLFEDQR